MIADDNNSALAPKTVEDSDSAVALATMNGNGPAADDAIADGHNSVAAGVDGSTEKINNSAANDTTGNWNDSVTAGASTDGNHSAIITLKRHRIEPAMGRNVKRRLPEIVDDSECSDVEIPLELPETMLESPRSPARFESTKALDEALVCKLLCRNREVRIRVQDMWLEVQDLCRAVFDGSVGVGAESEERTRNIAASTKSTKTLDGNTLYTGLWNKVTSPRFMALPGSMPIPFLFHPLR
ncbi:hypothetical protein NA57DRAFT_73189 [Rhizodiscina lignyota]|uniref:Uncharacterized protein n=1 Tax=Rhizodiscina lignyota TaxID=1504668 RepID=A0A9P4IL65_9PEZI|nr:hypothetical protein NA57DRAFT_73189 [Rhizodiscina lignyota]